MFGMYHIGLFSKSHFYPDMVTMLTSLAKLPPSGTGRGQSGLLSSSSTHLGQGWSSVLGSVGSWDTSAMICVSSLERDNISLYEHDMNFPSVGFISLIRTKSGKMFNLICGRWISVHILQTKSQQKQKCCSSNYIVCPVDPIKWKTVYWKRFWCCLFWISIFSWTSFIYSIFLQWAHFQETPQYSERASRPSFLQIRSKICIWLYQKFTTEYC